MEKMIREAQEDAAGDQALGKKYGTRGGVQTELKQENSLSRNGRKPSVWSLAADP